MLFNKQTWSVNNPAYYLISLLVISSCQSLQPRPTHVLSSTPTQIPAIATSTRTHTATPLPIPTITATSTPNTIAVLTSEYNIPGACLINYLQSSDNEWIGADCELYKKFLIAQHSGDQIEVPYQELSDLDPAYFTVQPLNWSADSRYFYFAPNVKCCLGYLPFNDSNTYGSLYQFDTEKREWHAFIHAIYAPYYYFSADGNRLAYFNHHLFKDVSAIEYLEVGMIEISSSKSKRIVLTGYNVPISELPRHAWSNSNDKFAIVLEHVIFSESRTDHVLLRIDFNKMDMELLEEFSPGALLDEK